MKNTQVRNLRRRVTKPWYKSPWKVLLQNKREASKKKAGSYLKGSATEGFAH